MIAYLDSGASETILSAAAAADVAKIKKPNFALNTPSHVPIHTSKTLELRLKKLPEKAREAFRMDDVPHNLVAVATLVDAVYSVHMYYWGFEVDYNGETIYKGRQSTKVGESRTPNSSR